MGEVYKAIQLSLERTVAIKLLPLEMAKEEAFIARFEKEAAALAALSHPNIVSIVDKGTNENTSYLVMEYVGGPSLRQLLCEKSLDWVQSVRIILDIARAIDYAHNRGVVHRDLKPENILFDTQAGFIPKVTDFGLASFFRHGNLRFMLTETHVSMGTFAYMAPEQQINAKYVDGRADLYSLGVMLYEMLMGDVPRGNFDLPSATKPVIDRRVDPIIARCLKASPNDRYPSVAALITDLEILVPHQKQISASPQIHLSSTCRARRALASATRRAVRWGHVGLIALSVIVLLITWIRSKKAEPGSWELRAQAATTGLPLSHLLGVPGRINTSFTNIKLTLGEGPESIPLVSLGDEVSREGNQFVFKQGGYKGGLAYPEVADLSGITASIRAQLVPPRDSSSNAMKFLRRLFFGEMPDPRSALVLQGRSGQYAAVVISQNDLRPALEWNLGERRGIMVGPTAPPLQDVTVELSIDRQGELRAWLGEGKERKLIGEPLGLGTGWKKLFGTSPKPAMACIAASCRFNRLTYELQRAVQEQLSSFSKMEEPPKPEPPLPPKTSPRGSSAKKTSARKKRR
jgi:serine/threonine protein kinase